MKPKEVGSTTIRVKRITRDRLHALKNVDDSFNDVIEKLLGGDKHG